MPEKNSAWQPSCSLEQIKARAELYAQTRAFFADRHIMEVETPILSAATATDPHLESIALNAGFEGAVSYLQTSPEFAMKRLLAAGSGDIFQLCKTFRKGESGARHNPEFSMLEWYRVGFSLEDLMKEVFVLVTQITGQERELESLSYREAFIRELGVDPFNSDESALRELCLVHCGYEGESLERDAYLDLLLSHCIEPKLGQNNKASFLWAYPASQAALAETFIDTSGNRVARRFELYLNGLEIANGYQELTDANEQRRRFDQDNQHRQALGLDQVVTDEYLIAALASGLPRCSGVALGVDRLLMVKTGARDIAEVLAFPQGRA